MKSGALSIMQSRLLSAAQANGVYVREENGRLIEVTWAWASPLIKQMSKSACHYAQLGVTGRKDHSLVLSRRMVNALQSFVAKCEKVG